MTPDGVRQIGYFITKWDVAFFVKYDDSRAEAVYSQHTLYGSAIDCKYGRIGCFCRFLPISFKN